MTRNGAPLDVVALEIAVLRRRLWQIAFAPFGAKFEVVGAADQAVLEDRHVGTDRVHRPFLVEVLRGSIRPHLRADIEGGRVCADQRAVPPAGTASGSGRS